MFAVNIVIVLECETNAPPAETRNLELVLALQGSKARSKSQET